MVTGHLARVQGGEYYWLRLEFNPSGTTTLKISRQTDAEGYVELAELVPVPDLTYSAGDWLRLRSSVVGGVLAVSAWPVANPEPVGWMLTVGDVAIRGAGLPGLQSWVVSGFSGSLPLVVSHSDYRAIDRRAVVEVPTWPMRSNLAGTDRWVSPTGWGISHRLGQRAKPLTSALRRAVLAAGPLAYWPLEDPAGSTSAASPVAGVAPMTLLGVSRFTVPGSGGVPQPAAGLPEFASGSGIPGSGPVLDLSRGGVLRGTVPLLPDADGWRIEWPMLCQRDQADSRVVLLWETNDRFTDHPDPGTMQWRVQIESGGIFAGYERNGIMLGTCTATFTVFDGLPHHYRFDATTISGELVVYLYIDNVAVAQFESLSDTMDGRCGQAFEVIVNPLEEVNGDASMPILGHVAVWSPVPAASTTAEATTGHTGETAGARFARLCTEQGIPYAVVGDPDRSTPMGAQGRLTLPDLLQECADADGGIFADQRGALALLLRLRHTLYNQTPVELPYTRIAPELVPIDGDANLRNDVTISGPAGEYRAVVESGPLSTLPYEDGGVGVYDDSPPVTEVNVNGRNQLRHAAWWTASGGTVDAARYSSIPVLLSEHVWTDLDDVALVVALDGGDLLELTGLSGAGLPPDSAPVIVQAAEESFEEAGRRITWQATPGQLYRVGVVGSTTRVTSPGTATVGEIEVGNDSDAEIEDISGTGRLWIRDADHPNMFPFDVLISGVRLTVTGIADDSDPQLMSINPTPVNGVFKTIPSGSLVTLAEPWRLAR